MRGFRFGALELVPSPLVREDNVAAAPKGKPRIRTRWATLNLFPESSFHSLSRGRMTWLLRRKRSAVCELVARQRKENSGRLDRKVAAAIANEAPVFDAASQRSWRTSLIPNPAALDERHRSDANHTPGTAPGPSKNRAVNVDCFAVRPYSAFSVPTIDVSRSRCCRKQFSPVQSARDRSCTNAGSAADQGIRQPMGLGENQA